MSVIQQDMARRVAYQLAAADLLRAARDFAVAARNLATAARAWDADGSREDVSVTSLVDAVGGLLALAADSSPGVRQLMQAACAPAAKEEE